MKSVLISCCLIVLLFNSVKAQNTEAEIGVEVNWTEDFSEAISLSKSTNKPILVFFTGSDWCSPCKMLVADVFETNKFRALSEKEFILYKADFPRNKNLVSTSQSKENSKLKDKYRISSFPTIVIINEKGKELGLLKGYNLMREASYHYAFFENTLKKNK